MDATDFITRWTKREGGAERANYQMFLSELCDVIGVPRPEPAGAERRHNDYVFERGVKRRESEGLNSTTRIDLYKRGCFILEAKQSRTAKGAKVAPNQLSLLPDEREVFGRRTADKGWDALMLNARKQAEDYVFRLDPDHAAPPFVIVCDVGHVLELFADFSGTGRGYTQFPDRQSFRIYMEDLRDEKVRARLAAVWTDPHSLDPARHSARVTREIAERLAAVSKVLEMDHPAEAVAHFLMRCIFTMFAEDVDLLPKGKFTELLKECLDTPASFKPLLDELWGKMDNPDYEGRFFSLFKQHIRHFNGNLFKAARAFPLAKEEIGELLVAASKDWREADPAIFGALLEQALDPKERHRLGAHFTPRAYVERLVAVTVMEPLRDDWNAVKTQAADAMTQNKRDDAVGMIRTFHHALCATRVLDPACGTGNFLYVSLELMKRLEGEVLEALAELGEPESIGLETVDPHQFLGLELNPRAAAIAEVVVWLGYLQQHYKTRTGHPAEPILRAFTNINFGRRGQGYDAVLTWDGYPALKLVDGKQTYPNARRPDWPEAEFIVGNPPFIGGKDIRGELGSGYAEALWAAHKAMNDSADFVMYWWDRAADILTRKKTRLRCFGFVTTNSISQVFQRRVIDRWMKAKPPVSILFAIADHPWTKAGRDAAAVRIAMTAVTAGKADGVLYEATREVALDTDAPIIELSETRGRINSDLTVGADVTAAVALMANEGVCSPGVKLHGAGFIVTPEEAAHLGLGRRPGLENHIRHYRHGRDIAQTPRGFLVIDAYPLSQFELRSEFPEVYQRVLTKVKPERDNNNMRWRRENWQWFGATSENYRSFVENLEKYIVTPETTKHRFFTFLDRSLLADNMLVAIGSEDSAILAVLSSRVHTTWAPRAGGWLGMGNDPRYSKSRCFDPFPFPDPSPVLKARLRKAGERLDAFRKERLAEHPHLTMTGLYNVREAIRAGRALTSEEARIKDEGLVLILNELHDEIDTLTAEAYGWPVDLPDEQILERLVALNAERAREEAAGQVCWLRPDYQIPRFAKGAAAKTGELDLGAVPVPNDVGKPVFPKEAYAQPLAVKAALFAAARPLQANDLSQSFKGPFKARSQRITQILATLSLYGEIDDLGDGRYLARKVA